MMPRWRSGRWIRPHLLPGWGEVPLGSLPHLSLLQSTKATSVTFLPRGTSAC